MRTRAENFARVVQCASTTRHSKVYELRAATCRAYTARSAGRRSSPSTIRSSGSVRRSIGVSRSNRARPQSRLRMASASQRPRASGATTPRSLRYRAVPQRQARASGGAAMPRITASGCASASGSMRPWASIRSRPFPAIQYRPRSRRPTSRKPKIRSGYAARRSARACAVVSAGTSSGIRWAWATSSSPASRIQQWCAGRDRSHSLWVVREQDSARARASIRGSISLAAGLTSVGCQKSKKRPFTALCATAAGPAKMAAVMRPRSARATAKRYPEASRIREGRRDRAGWYSTRLDRRERIRTAWRAVRASALIP